MIMRFSEYLRKLILRIMAAIIIIGPVMKGLFSSGDWIIIQVALSITLLFEIYKKIIMGDMKHRVSYFDVFNGILILLYFLSIFWGIHKYGAYTIAFRYLSYYLAFYLVINNVVTKKDRDFLLYAIFSSAFLAGILAFLLSGDFNILGLKSTGVWRIDSTFQYPNTFASFLAASFIIGIVLLTNQEKMLVRQYLSAGLFIIMAGIVGAQSRGIFIIFVVVSLLLIAFHVKEHKKISNLLYNYLIITITGTYSAGLFFEKIRFGDYQKGLLQLGAGLIFILILTMLTDAVIKRLSKVTGNKSISNIVLAGIILYVLVIGVFYFNYLLSADPTARDSIIGAGVTQRLGEIDSRQSSYTSRLTYDRDALKIMVANPFGAGGRAWDSLYHQFQDYEYWSTEVHNNFLQLGVETGFPGLLLYLGSWLLIFYGGYWVYKERKREEDSNIHIAIILALLLLFLHGAMDFDFSYGIINIMMMTLAALVLYREKSRRLRFGELKLSSLVLKTIMLLSIVFVLLPSVLELTSEIYAREADRSWELNETIANYEKAVKYSPLNNNLRAILAKKYSERYLKTADSRDFDRVNEFTDLNLNLAPNNIWSLAYLQDAHFNLKNQRRLLALREHEASILPVSPTVNAMLGDEYIKTTLFELKEGNREEALKNKESALAAIDPFLHTEKINPYLKDKSQLRPVQQHYLVIGKISFLEGDYQNAMESFKKVTRGQNLLDESLLWRMAAYIRVEEPEKAELLVNKIQNQDLLLQLYDIAKVGGIFAGLEEREDINAGR